MRTTHAGRTNKSRAFKSLLINSARNTETPKKLLKSTVRRGSKEVKKLEILTFLSIARRINNIQNYMEVTLDRKKKRKLLIGIMWYGTHRRNFQCKVWTEAEA